MTNLPKRLGMDVYGFDDEHSIVGWGNEHKARLNGDYMLGG
jgi:hypothetical protein